MPGLVWLLGSVLLVGNVSAAVVEVCDEPTLRAAISAGGHVQLLCNGTIPLSNTLTITTNCVVDATGCDVTLDGGGQVRVLHVISGAELTLLNIRISGGRSTNGGGIFNEGKLVLGGCKIIGNAAVGTPGVANVHAPAVGGGGIFNVGHLVIADSLIATNMAIGGVGAPGLPGAWAVDVIDQFGRCRTIPGSGPFPGGPGYEGGWASGGGLHNGLGTAMIVRTTFVMNRCHGGEGGAGGSGGRGGCTSGCASAVGGTAGAGGRGAGGAIGNGGTLVISDSLLAHNEARGGSGGRGGSVDCFFVLPAGRGGNGGEGQGGGLTASGPVTAWNVTISGNLAHGGDGGFGGSQGPVTEPNRCPSQPNGNGGDAYGGGVVIPVAQAGLHATNLTIWNNDVAGGIATNAFLFLGTNCPVMRGTNGQAFGASVAAVPGYLVLANSILGNLAATNNVYGGVTDLGHNICSDDTAGFGAPGSHNNADPRLTALAKNGGTTQTCALRADSIAIDGGNNALGSGADQRGVLRPQGSGCDIGAYEATFLNIALDASHNTRLEFSWIPLDRCRLQSSSDLIAWNDVENRTADSNGRVQFTVTSNAGARFYRISEP